MFAPCCLSHGLTRDLLDYLESLDEWGCSDKKWEDVVHRDRYRVVIGIPSIFD
jgi:hypothetical protein